MSLSAFLNPVKEENIKTVISKRFVNEYGTPIEWELRSLTSEEDEIIRKSCTNKIPIHGRAGQYTQETNFEKYLALMAAKCTVYPNLNDIELQNGYGAMGADSLLKAMLKPGEYAELLKKVQEINGYSTTLNEQVEEAKN